jgi:hypothetical protein
VIEFIFCPTHGVFAPANWPLIAPIIGACYVKLAKYRRLKWHR